MTSTTAPAALLPAPSPAAAAAAPSRRRLTRSATDRRLGGVAGGLADHTGVDAVLWRVGFVVLTLAGGSGIAAYGLLWLLMPPADAA
ncbi:PspC domain-containing protein [Modestobacter versicolor]|uniref:PspC domain-containing protein n=1 Tax=Modestobacter versicolor TaxID=429133 RepID=UPI0034DDF7E3